MDIFEFAIEKEQKSEDLYRGLFERTANKGLRSVFKLPADEERHHSEVVEQLKITVPKEVSQTDVLAGARKVFEKMRKSTEAFDFDVAEVDVYKKARQTEAEGRRFYLEKVEQVENAAQAQAIS